MQGHSLSAFRVRQHTHDEAVELDICRTANRISSACMAVNNHLRDKPLHLWGSLRKGFRAKMGYEINGGIGWRRDVCLPAASKSSELACMSDRLDTSPVLLKTILGFFSHKKR